MDLLIKVISCATVTLILGLIIPADRKEIKVVIGVVACSMIAATAIAYIEPLVDFVEQVKSVSNLSSEMIKILWKTVGVGVLTEIAGLICKDFGNGTMDKMIQLVGSAAILWLTIPLFQNFMDLIENVLERM